MQSAVFQNLFDSKDIRDLPKRQMQAVMAARFCIICHKVGREPVEDLSIRFRSIPAAKAFVNLMSAIGKVWPEPFAIMRPCCSAVSVDELVLSAMVGAEASRDRQEFDAALEDMIDAKARTTLFDATVIFAASFNPLPIIGSK